MPGTVPFDELQQFFSAFCSAFPAFNGGLIAERYAAPYLALNAEGQLQCFATNKDIAAYFQAHLDRYRAQSCCRCEFSNLEYLSIGSQSVLATVTWQLLRADGALVSCWRESYNLRRYASGLLIYASTDHVA